MELLTWVLGVVALAGVGAAAWLLAERRGLVRARDQILADRADAVAARDEATRARESAERALAEARTRLESAHEQLQREGERLDREVRDALGRADSSTARVLDLSKQNASLSQRLEEAARRLDEHAAIEKRMTDAFRALTSDALKMSREEFLVQVRPIFEAAKKEQSDLVKPINEVLASTREKLDAIEKLRVESFARLHEKLEGVTGSSEGLRAETARLTRALSRPEIRGQYGEMQLRRVAELAGMTSYCDFEEQSSVRDADGNMLRPDMIVRLPNDRVIAVDAKTNIYAYIEACNAASDSEREEHLSRFSRHVCEQAKKLGAKRYWSQYDGSPDFVVMFVPGDHFIDAALQRHPALLDEACQQGVILASPSTLIGLLRAVAVGWREHSLTEQAAELFTLGRELHERAAVAFQKIDELGKLIGSAGKKYNEVVGSIDGRLVPTLRKFEEAGATSARTIAELKTVDESPRQLRAGTE